MWFLFSLMCTHGFRLGRWLGSSQFKEGMVEFRPSLRENEPQRKKKTRDCRQYDKRSPLVDRFRNHGVCKQGEHRASGYCLKENRHVRAGTDECLSCRCCHSSSDENCRAESENLVGAVAGFFEHRGTRRCLWNSTHEHADDEGNGQAREPDELRTNYG